ncbi:MAG: hypothetical protein LBU60_00120 [Clostridiales bacterium]|jgi:4-diphosphocytidyl-2-C-methyl-D-erythritol kinase|nr:hypothetical protein [Clostridiales bacterium]
MQVDINAKLNLSLNVLGKKEQLHLLDSILCSVNIFDTITLMPRSDNKITVNFEYQKISGLGLSQHTKISNTNNTALKMAELVKSEFKLSGMDIYIEKRIPQKAGLGGSAADAAGALLLMNKQFGLGLSWQQMYTLSSKIGADVAYMCKGGLCRQIDSKNILDNITGKKLDLKSIILSNGEGISTKKCFLEFDRIFKDGVHLTSDNELLQFAILNNNREMLYKNIGNSLLDASMRLNSKIAYSIDLLKSTGAKVASMTGSGSACFGIYGEEINTDEVAKSLQSKCDYVYACKIL